MGAGFTVGMMGMEVKYYLKFHHRVLSAAAVAVRTKLLSSKQKQQEQEGQHSLTWTLDYDRLSDFGKNFTLFYLSFKFSEWLFFDFKAI